MGEETGNLKLMIGDKEININDIGSIGIEHPEYSKETSKPLTSMKCRIKINAHDVEMALYRLTEDMSIFYKKSYFANGGLQEIYKF